MSHQLRNAPLSQLPVGWCWATFSDAATVAADLVPPKEWPNLPHIAPDNIQRDTGRLLPYRTIAEDGVTSAKHLFEAGQLLYSKIRPYLNKCVRVDFRGLCSADMYPLDAHIDAGYLHQYILSRQFVSAVTKASGSRTVLPKTNQEQLSEIPIPVAPIPEQERISEAIDSHLSRLDAAVETLEAAQKKLKAYRASVLKAAVEGRLVPTEAAFARAEKRDFEPADVLLKRILSERRRRWEQAELAKLKAAGKSPKDDKWKAKYEEPTAPETTNLPQIPEGWCWTTVPAITLGTKEGMRTGPFGSLLKKHEHMPSGVPVIGIENIEPMTFVFGSKIHISAAKASELAEYDVQPWDLLISRSGTVGEVCVAPEELGHARFSTNVIRLRFALGGALPRFIAALLNGSPFVRAQITNLCRGTTRDFLNQHILNQLLLPLPPEHEQERLLGELDRLLSMVHSLDQQQGVARLRLRRLRQSILKWAFEGKLVDQDPNDEPAEKLLARIRAERAATETPTRTRRARKSQ